MYERCAGSGDNGRLMMSLIIIIVVVSDLWTITTPVTLTPFSLPFS